MLTTCALAYPTMITLPEEGRKPAIKPSHWTSPGPAPEARGRELRADCRGSTGRPRRGGHRGRPRLTAKCPSLSRLNPLPASCRTTATINAARLLPTFPRPDHSPGVLYYNFPGPAPSHSRQMRLLDALRLTVRGLRRRRLNSGCTTTPSGASPFVFVNARPSGQGRELRVAEAPLRAPVLLL